eukprot:TRINITY_DN92802_c0_g1_i1.p4 TRINITY_DN92802_c0_g1~~TRINITY_DN92802_c0_g1_i1.p4  ORF type:complete len:126 (+),score=24.53 TRINITY_DN92802_c0_g1_i1:161-538(+)
MNKSCQLTRLVEAANGVFLTGNLKQAAFREFRYGRDHRTLVCQRPLRLHGSAKPPPGLFKLYRTTGSVQHQVSSYTQRKSRKEDEKNGSADVENLLDAIKHDRHQQGSQQTDQRNNTPDNPFHLA